MIFSSPRTLSLFLPAIEKLALLVFKSRGGFAPYFPHSEPTHLFHPRLFNEDRSNYIKIKMRTVFLFTAFLFFGSLAYSQHDLSEERMKELKELKQELEGTYQIQMMGTRARPSIPMEVFGKIRSKRKEQEATYHSVDENTRIKILPRERIDEEDFQGVEERIVYIEKKK